MKRIAIIGGGIAGLSIARMLRDSCEVKVFERENSVGGLARCRRAEGNLFHLCGGHVFNTKNSRVSNWFWKMFDANREFRHVARKSAICLNDNSFIDYPIENHVYQLEESVQRSFAQEVIASSKTCREPSQNFRQFLLAKFGKTLCELYFFPYNQKIWRRDLSSIPLSWLDGKLPMPTFEEMIFANINRSEEKDFVHSSFWYPTDGGSQFVVDRIAQGVDVVCDLSVKLICKRNDGTLSIDGNVYDKIVYTGCLRDLPELLPTSMLPTQVVSKIEQLEFHGTTSVLCTMDENPYTWLYQPSIAHDSHRIICTGNLALSNNASVRKSCIVEFTDNVERAVVEDQLARMPYRPRYVAQHYTPCSYPVQHAETRELVEDIRRLLAKSGVFLVGRLAEWEYYNMDAVMASAFKVAESILSMG